MSNIDHREEHDGNRKSSEKADEEAPLAPGVGDRHVFCLNSRHELIQKESK